MRVQRVLLVGLCGLWVATAVLAGSKPVAVSPGDASKLVLIGDPCPTFSWGEVDAAESYELVVYRVGEEGDDARPVLRQAFAGSASSWTPSLNRCLDRGGRYAWSVRAIGAEDTSAWSPPNLFQVAAGTSAAEFEAALQVVRGYLDAGDEVRTPTGALDESQVEPGADATASSPRPRAVGTTELSVEGGVVAESFTGDGSTLTSLDPANLSTGTAGIDISGTAATASDLVGAACVSESELTFDPATQAEMAAHALLAGVHHTPTVDTDTTCHGAACDGTNFTNLQWASLASVPTTTKGDLLVEDGADVVRLGVGTDGQLLVADSSQSAGVTWATVADSTRLCSAPALVPRTGQTYAYSGGDDGSLQRGVVWPDPRFTNNADGTVTDNMTGLIWLLNANCPNATRAWTTALSDVAQVNIDGTMNGNGCGDTSNGGSHQVDWRLPHVRELHSLIDFSQSSPALPSGHPFSGVQSSYYWSSTTTALYSSFAWGVFFGDGYANFVLKDGNAHYVWPVRGGQ